MPAQDPIDIIATQILFDAKSALANLKKFNEEVTDSGKRVKILKDIIRATAGQIGGDFKKAEAHVKSFANSLTKIKASEVSQAGKELQNLGNRSESAFQKAITGVNAFRIALGALISMLLFQGIQAITQFASESIKQFTELEETLFRIQNVEEELSKAGVEISVSGLKKGIKELREELRIFSEEELAKLVGKVAISTKDLKYNEDQILALSKAIAILNLRSTEVEDLSQTSGKVITALLSGTTKGVSGLGLQLNDAAIKARAVKDGFLEAGESVDKLSKKEKDLVKLQIILENAATEENNFNEFLTTNSAKLKENVATWEDLQVAVGGFTSSAIPALSDFIGTIIDVVNAFKALIPIWDTFTATSVALRDAALSTLNPLERAKRLAEVLKNIPNTFKDIAKQEIPKLFGEIPEDAPEWFKDLYGDFFKDTETATAKVEDLLNLDDDELAKTLAEIDDKLRDIAIDAEQAKEDLAVALQQKQEDLDIKFQQKRTDIDTEYARKEEDAARDLARKIQDINRDAEREKKRVIDKARDEERKAEEDHQLKLWELKMRYLMDLEDALHARDARQIIRLQKQYELDKQLLEKKKEQEDDERAKSLEADLEEVERRKNERLEDAQIEYQEKLADLAAAKARELEELNVWKAREEADLQLWYQRELAEIDRHTQQKIERLLAGYIEEQKIHEENQEAIHQILLKYFGKNMDLVNSLMSATNQMFSNMAAQAASAFSYASPFLNVPQLTQEGLDQYHQSEWGFKQGGTLIATRPTTATFGEVPEAVTFTPLNHQGRNTGKIFSTGGGSGGEGRIALDINLSPDLQARIVEESMNGVADVIARVNRAKV